MTRAHPETCTCGNCGKTTEFRDFGYQLPDCIWEQPAEERSQRNTKNFAELDERRFIRGLLPIKLSDGEEFRYGIWLEVDQITFVDAFESWNDEARYPKLSFKATVANAVPPWRARILGAEVEVGVRDPNSRPFVTSSTVKWLQTVLEDGWTTLEYEAAADELLGRK